MSTGKKIWTIGHSTRTIEELVSMLRSFSISVLVDVRNYPGSKRYPHFNKESLQVSMPESGIEYLHFKDLGGRRQPAKDSMNTRWKNSAFRGYADYMSTSEFQKSIKELESVATAHTTAYMCSEAVWWSCHRALISDYLKAAGWQVWHIMDEKKATEHPYTKAALIIDGKLHYDEPGLF